MIRSPPAGVDPDAWRRLTARPIAHRGLWGLAAPENSGVSVINERVVGPYQVTHKNGERCSAAKAYLTPNLGRPNLQVWTGAQVSRLITAHGEHGTRVTGVEALARAVLEVPR